MSCIQILYYYFPILIFISLCSLTILLRSQTSQELEFQSMDLQWSAPSLIISKCMRLARSGSSDRLN